jgi:hypothetical protein
MQNTFAGMNPNWPVRKPITQTTPLLTAATTHPFQHRFPTRIVEPMVSKQDK